jgi:hypothetical protein
MFFLIFVGRATAPVSATAGPRHERAVTVFFTTFSVTVLPEGIFF